MKEIGIKTSGLTDSRHGHWKSLVSGRWWGFGAGGSRGVEKRSLKSWPMHTRTLSWVQASREDRHIKHGWLTAQINLSIHPGGPFSRLFLDPYHIQGWCDLAGAVTQDHRGPLWSHRGNYIFNGYICQSVFTTRAEKTKRFGMKEQVIFSLGSARGCNSIRNR